VASRLQLQEKIATSPTGVFGSNGLMDSTNGQRFTRTEVRLDEPHFDEEATLLSAQPVVPLVEVKAETLSKARLTLALAIGGGLLIGLLAATLIYRYVGANEPQVVETTAVTEQANTDQQQNSAGGHTASADETAVITTEEEKSPTVTPQETEPAPAQPATAAVEPEPARRNAPGSRPVIVRDSPEIADDEDVDREIRRAERQEERRERRRAAREARKEPRVRTQTTDDLLRIREIFEGTPRP
jgi:cytoskeletal protein RodZ